MFLHYNVRLWENAIKFLLWHVGITVQIYEKRQRMFSPLPLFVNMYNRNWNVKWAFYKFRIFSRI